MDDVFTAKFNYFQTICVFEGPHDVRVRMKAVGICGSDVHYLKVHIILLHLISNVKLKGMKFCLWSLIIYV